MRIRKRELYPENDVYVDRVISDMVKLPILHVGKSTKRRATRLIILQSKPPDKLYQPSPRIYLAITLQCNPLNLGLGEKSSCITKFPNQSGKTQVRYVTPLAVAHLSRLTSVINLES